MVVITYGLRVWLWVVAPVFSMRSEWFFNEKRTKMTTGSTNTRASNHSLHVDVILISP